MENLKTIFLRKFDNFGQADSDASADSRVYSGQAKRMTLDRRTRVCTSVSIYTQYTCTFITC